MMILDGVKDKTVLECGCGRGDFLFELARNGARACGIDISNLAIQELKQRAKKADLPITYEVMNVEAMTFEDKSFDVIFGSGILHHLDLSRALQCISKKLKMNGKAVFIEPMGHNYLINAFRRKTPELRTEDEHPLLMTDFVLAKKYFKRVTQRFYFLFTLVLPILLKEKTPKAMLSLIHSFDQGIFRLFPFVQKYAWQVLVELSEPIQTKTENGS